MKTTVKDEKLRKLLMLEIAKQGKDMDGDHVYFNGKHYYVNVISNTFDEIFYEGEFNKQEDKNMNIPEIMTGIENNKIDITFNIISDLIKSTTNSGDCLSYVKTIERIKNELSLNKNDSMMVDINKVHHTYPDRVIIVLSGEEMFSDVSYFIGDNLLRSICTDTINIKSTPEEILEFISTSEVDLLSNNEKDDLIEKYTNSYIWDYFKTDDHIVTVERGFTFLETEEVFINKLSSDLGEDENDICIYADGEVKIENIKEYFIKENKNEK